MKVDIIVFPLALGDYGYPGSTEESLRATS